MPKVPQRVSGSLKRSPPPRCSPPTSPSRGPRSGEGSRGSSPFWLQGLALPLGPQGDPQGEHSPTPHPYSEEPHLGFKEPEVQLSKKRAWGPWGLGESWAGAPVPKQGKNPPRTPRHLALTCRQGTGLTQPLLPQSPGKPWDPPGTQNFPLDPQDQTSPHPLPSSSPSANGVSQGPTEDLSNFPWDP